MIYLYLDAVLLVSDLSWEVFMSNNSMCKNDAEMQALLSEIYEALCEKGYDPTKQIAGYILSEDPVYITDWKNARGKISRINRDDLLRMLINNYLSAFEASPQE